MKYQTVDGEVYDLDDMLPAERQIFDWMYEESISSQSWPAFVDTWNPSVISEVKKNPKYHWQSNPLYRIKMDLMGRIGVRTGEMSSGKRDHTIEVIIP